jgi:hypothetical protein
MGLNKLIHLVDYLRDIGFGGPETGDARAYCRSAISEPDLRHPRNLTFTERHQEAGDVEAIPDETHQG